MNQFRDLLARYADTDGLRVDTREWLMLLELDPATAARVMTHLAVLAAEDLTLTLAAQAQAALDDAAGRADACATAHDAARSDIAGYAARITAARDRALAIWADTIRPLLTDLDVLHPAATTRVVRAPRTWTDGWVKLPGVGSAYPASIATRRRHTGYPIVRFDRHTCERIAADLAAAQAADPRRHGPAHLLPAAILADADTVVLTVGADSLEDAWTADATVLIPDADGLYPLGARRWPWQIDHTRTDQHTPPAIQVSHRATEPSTSPAGKASAHSYHELRREPALRR
jgi:hypothetical protein